MKKLNLLLLVVLGITMLSGCADVSYVQECLPAAEHTYGFWGGTWHGMISGFAFIGSLFDSEIAIYAVNNNGAWYDFGFVGGLVFLLKMINLVLTPIASS
jgi:hypothetical protein